MAAAFVFSLLLKNYVSKEKAEKAAPSKYIADLKEGAGFIRRDILLYIIIAAVATSFFGEITAVNRPMFVEYHIGAQGYIAIVVMAIIGGLIASVFVGTFGNKFKLGRFIFTLFVVAGIVRIAFAFTLPVSYMGALIISVASATLATSLSIIFSSLNQKIPPENMVGRVDTIDTTFKAIFVAIGALAGGVLGSVIPVDYIFILHGVSYIAIGVFIILVPGIRKLPNMNGIERRQV